MEVIGRHHEEGRHSLVETRGMPSKQANDKRAKVETSSLDLGQTVYLFACSN